MGQLYSNSFSTLFVFLGSLGVAEIPDADFTDRTDFSLAFSVREASVFCPKGFNHGDSQRTFSPRPKAIAPGLHLSSFILPPL
jgi:hypothetical protein